MANRDGCLTEDELLFCLNDQGIFYFPLLVALLLKRRGSQVTFIFLLELRLDLCFSTYKSLHSYSGPIKVKCIRVCEVAGESESASPQGPDLACGHICGVAGE